MRKKTPVNPRENQNLKNSLVRKSKPKILNPLTKIAKLKAPDIKNNEHENNQNNNDYLSNKNTSINKLPLWF